MDDHRTIAGGALTWASDVPIIVASIATKWLTINAQGTVTFFDEAKCRKCAAAFFAGNRDMSNTIAMIVVRAMDGQLKEKT